jgi:hypothetical protein
MKRSDENNPGPPLTAEEQRLAESQSRIKHWKRWGPYLSERAWGTVREDYSADGNAWQYLTHDQSRSKAYRWNEDGLGGICDRHQNLCFALALWNGRDPILKERLFGLTGFEGNHGEDVKEYYFYSDSTPTHSYMRFLYKYPHAEFPYARLVDENARRSKLEPEFELVDTGIFDEDRYFDVIIEYAKADIDDILVLISATNHGPEPAAIHLLPSLWLRNTWSWDPKVERPALRRVDDTHAGQAVIEVNAPRLGQRWLIAEPSDETLFTENETNVARLFGTPNLAPYVKDAFHRHVVEGTANAVNPADEGTKAAVHYVRTIAPGATESFRLRLTDQRPAGLDELGDDFERVFADRRAEADAFYGTVIPAERSDEERKVMRQAFAGLLWSKQYYHYVVRRWLDGDPGQPAPPVERLEGRNHQWTHLYNADVLSMPDAWEYPWYAAWDLAFHCVPLSLVDPEFAKGQLVLMLREWYMHPNGQLPAYEWNLNDVNPPVHAWAAWRVYKIDRKRTGVGDRLFLERVFHKLLLNFTWWVNRKDAEGNNIFQGGFLGLDNIGVFDRSRPLPTGGHVEQSDGTSWMAMYALNLLAIALELARENPAYEDVASKFWEHFLAISHAMNHRGNDGVSLWDDEDGFFYDVLHHDDGTSFPMRVRSMVGLIPLFAVQTIEPEDLDRLPDFKRRLEWFIDNQPDLVGNVACMRTPGRGERRLMSIVDREKLVRVVRVMLDESEFLSEFGVRALSRIHLEHPYTLEIAGEIHRVDYEPAESSSGLFGGNSNWRGPVWFPVNFLIVESLQKFAHYYGDDLKVDCPTGSGRFLTLWEIGEELSRRMSRLFIRNDSGGRPVNGNVELFRRPAWREHVLFYEYFDGDSGRGLGASHQTGWTGLVAKLLQQTGVG